MMTLMIAFLLALGVLLGALAGFCIYRQGIRDGEKKASGEPPAPLLIPPVKAGKEASAELLRLRAVMANLEAYDGTAKGQKKVE